MAEYFVKNIIICINTQPNLCKNLEIWLSIAIFAENILNVLAMIIGRENEQRQLLDLYKSDYSEFVAIYGRRRVGKTFLVRETFNYRFAFQHTGIQGGDKKRQLEEFAQSLHNAGMKNVPQIKDWFKAFHTLEDFLAELPDGKKILFFDELPWMDTQKSDFVSALEHFWNGWATARKDILLVVCGSAASWIVSKIVMNYGGLHNRLSRQIFLRPFTLHECERYVHALGIDFTRKQILETYMVLGGIPYYWTFVQKRYSVAQNIDQMFFAEGAPLRAEFNALYASLFKNSKPYVQTVRVLGTKKAGMTRSEIVKNLGKETGGTMTDILKDLELCGFIRAYNSIGKTTKDSLYQLIDNYTLFYFKFFEENHGHNPEFWSQNVGRPLYLAWCGLAFERVCLHHSAQIKKALGISGILSNIFSWVYRPTSADETGVQIDMLIDRVDDVINLCEIKYSNSEYEIKKQYDDALQRKISTFVSKTGTSKAVWLVMITTSGLKPNAYANNIHSQVVMDDLFAE